MESREKKEFKIKRYFFLGSGIFFLVLGVVGIFLPLLPTTPFLLLTAYCFNRGSDTFHGWLMNHPILSPPIIDWQKHRAIRVRYKILASAMMLSSCFFIFPKATIPLAGKVCFGIFVLSMVTFIWTRKSR